MGFSLWLENAKLTENYFGHQPPQENPVDSLVFHLAVWISPKMRRTKLPNS